MEADTDPKIVPPEILNEMNDKEKEAIKRPSWKNKQKILKLFKTDFRQNLDFKISLYKLEYQI